MDTENRSRAIAEMVRRLVARFDPDQIILFGSEARGTADAGSDIRARLRDAFRLEAGAE